MTKLSQVLTLAIVALGSWQSVNAATVSYSGKLFAEFGPPVGGGQVFVGTFAPSFDPFDYNCVYGDETCNQVGGAFGGAFDSAVMEGNFFPIGSGAITNADGTFAGVGTTDAPAGTQIWMFAFEDQSRNSFYQVLTTSSNPAWFVPAQPSGVTALVANQADNLSLFVMGFPHPEGIQLNVIPFPEPMGLAMAGVMAPTIAILRRRPSSRRLPAFTWD